MSKNSYPSSHNQRRQTGRARRAIAGAALAATVATGGGIYAGVKAHNRSVASRPENVAKKVAQEKAKQAAEANANTRLSAIIDNLDPVLRESSHKKIENPDIDLTFTADFYPAAAANDVDRITLYRVHGRDLKNTSLHTEQLDISYKPGSREVTAVKATNFTVLFETDPATGEAVLKDGKRESTNGGGTDITMSHLSDGTWTIKGASNELSPDNYDMSLSTANPNDIADIDTLLTVVSDIGANLSDGDFGALAPAPQQ